MNSIYSLSVVRFTIQSRLVLLIIHIGSSSHVDRKRDNTGWANGAVALTYTYTCYSLALLPLQLLLDLPDKVHVLTRAVGRHDVPPAVQLEQPRPGQPHALPERPDLGAELEVDVPEHEGDDDDDQRPAPAHAPGPDPVGREGRLAPVEEVGAPRDDEDDHEEEGREVVDDLARVDVEAREEREEDGERGVDEAVAPRAPPPGAHGQQALQQGPGDAEHAELVGELQRLAQRGVEEEGAQAQDQQGGGHEVQPGPEGPAAAGTVHVPEGEVD
ncbi:uncharacterized protein E0L32_004145 [Thyridium curvatum]|uniref:Uncharacterized protein n=1 Tax=Thyridium curvatum TaxID=1093900 RepID=A0A507BHV9_9PEZI|nr:uncharacterized protein E0L32_004145 [Thyridium curvatum]TPX16150.1 hypothetical protein E0L32_004145 [Thyridium curvatum]